MFCWRRSVHDCVCLSGALVGVFVVCEYGYIYIALSGVKPESEVVLDGGAEGIKHVVGVMMIKFYCSER